MVARLLFQFNLHLLKKLYGLGESMHLYIFTVSNFPYYNHTGCTPTFCDICSFPDYQLFNLLTTSILLILGNKWLSLVLYSIEPNKILIHSVNSCLIQKESRIGIHTPKFGARIEL